MGSEQPSASDTRASGATAGKRVAILQSNYIPWKGYFDLLNSVDEFILYDDMQYTRRDWRNRNKIKTSQGPLWLTIPVEVKGKYHQRIRETVVSNKNWASQHWTTICHWYARARHFEDYRQIFEELYLGCEETVLSSINYRFLTAICEILGITTAITWSMDYALVDGKTSRLVDLCRQAGASSYISGPSARSYLEPELFREQGIDLEYIDYLGYPEYQQLFAPFVHEISIIDLILNEGADAHKFMKSF
jgi:hypothetical protein